MVPPPCHALPPAALRLERHKPSRQPSRGGRGRLSYEGETGLPVYWLGERRRRLRSGTGARHRARTIGAELAEHRLVNLLDGPWGFPAQVG